TAKNGLWHWDDQSRRICFTAAAYPEERFVMMFVKVPLNFRVLCSLRDVPGTGMRGSFDTPLDSELLTWVMGPANGRVKKQDEKRDPVGPNPALYKTGQEILYNNCSSTSCATSQCSSSYRPVVRTESGG